VEQVRRLIDEGQLKPGHRLPGERELALEFGVSRATLREAVQSLASLGLLEVRQGVGTRVSASATTAVDASFWLPWLTAHSEDVLALLDVREALETKAVELAAEAAGRGGAAAGSVLEALEGNLAEMERAVTAQDTVLLERLDLEFHSLLAQTAGNKYLLRFGRSVNHVFSDRRAVLSIPGRAAQSVADHRQILAGVKAGDPASAVRAMASHLASVKVAVAESRRHSAASLPER
jgi:GntR family transcriptional repressor for pyruvate dehydrogenase complex